MGYYDDDNFSGSEPPTRKPNGRRGGWFISGLLGAIVGIVFFFLISPFLENQGWLPSSSEQNANTNISSNSGGPTSTKNVSLNVTSSATKAVDTVSPAVVAVINLQSADFFDNQYTETGIGSGIIYKKDGNFAYVVTNNHVVEGAGKVEVRFDDETKVDAKVLGTDSLYDLAVLQIPSKQVKKVAQFGSSKSLKRGEPVIAIGNPLGFSGSVTEGIISAQTRSISRTIDLKSGGQVTWNAEVLQTDAAINPGNSGGALVNIDGQVVGINSLKISESSVEGIGFAIPIDVAQPVINQLETNGKVERPYIGVSMTDLNQLPAQSIQQLKVPNNVHTGIVVTDVVQGGPADKGGIQSGDVIVSIGGHSIDENADSATTDFSTYLYKNLNVGQTVKVKVYRNGKEKTLNVKLGGKVFS
ncbi:serine protease Do [Pullulanibacillus pueri]|uniref:Putative serine protease YyxA n=1 Tax=Pullulanibacillus pueri TaxID=1437324 RepID=A0A8J2ZUW8_9BACL|nr:trypsin-like peptidase domain-containing protein [Pullulanibacillus pueri]MBM7682197.1 serine protease Do [Pullulanibacillus pueri]GGH80410.1 putative serine protease YyxA [Pullulanibacillus pueri]